MKSKMLLVRTIVFVVGMVVMAYEILASRVLGPYFGVTIQVWANLIGTVLLTLSIGSWLGGKWADRSKTVFFPGFFLIVSGLLISLTPIIAPAVSATFVNLRWPVQYGSLAATLLLFGPATLLAGAFFPYAVKLSDHHEPQIATTMGTLGAISTLGSLAGTFLTSLFFLSVPWLGTKRILFLFGGAIILCGTLLILFERKKQRTKRTSRVLSFCFIIFASTLFMYWDAELPPLDPGTTLVAETESPYEPVRVIDQSNPDLKKVALPPEFAVRRQLVVPGQNGSTAIVFRDHPTLMSGMYYPNYVFISWLLKLEIKQIASIGCGGGIFPRDVLRMFPDDPQLHIDVVEINPIMFDLAKTYFSYPENDPRISNHVQDGRLFLKQSSSKYDLIYWDAFGPGLIVPEHTMTREFFAEVREHLTPGGVLALNIISALENEPGAEPRANLYLSLIKTVREAFGDSPILTYQLSRLFTGNEKGAGPYRAGNLAILIVNSPDGQPVVPDQKLAPRLNRFSQIAYYYDLESHLKTQVMPTVAATASLDLDKLPTLTDDYNPINLYLPSGIRRRANEGFFTK